EEGIRGYRVPGVQTCAFRAHHPEIRGRLVTGLTRGPPRGHRGVAGDRERRSGQARTAKLEAARAHVRGAVTARAVAVEGAERNEIGRASGRGGGGHGGGGGC